MNTFINIALPLHIASGLIALVCGFMAIVSKKGKNVHRNAGKVFFFSMLCVSVTAILIAMLKSNQFLFYIGIFAFFMNYSGFRSIKNKLLKPSLSDWIVLAVAAVNSFLMIYTTNIVLVVFGALSSFLVLSDLKLFVRVSMHKEIPKIQWLLRHIGMMLGTYIATTTAFLVVNVKDFNPAWLPWLLPTFLVTPLIIYWRIKYAPIKQK